MPKKKLMEDITHNPERCYRIPGDVLRDRRFDNTERREILTAWRRNATTESLAEIDAVIGELDARGLHAACVEVQTNRQGLGNDERRALSPDGEMV